jgi:hypothetical protein
MKPSPDVGRVRFLFCGDFPELVCFRVFMRWRDGKHISEKLRNQAPDSPGSIRVIRLGSLGRENGKEEPRMDADERGLLTPLK